MFFSDRKIGIVDLAKNEWEFVSASDLPVQSGSWIDIDIRFECFVAKQLRGGMGCIGSNMGTITSSIRP